MNSFIEKRDYARMKIVYEIQCKPKWVREPYQAWCTSLSGSGISFLSEQRFRVDDEVRIIIPPETAEENTIDFIVHIVRSELKKHGFYETAAKLEKMDDDKFGAISYRVNK